MGYSFEQIKPLIVKEDWNATQVSLEFKAPNQAEPIKATGMVIISQEAMQKQAMAGAGKAMAANIAVGTSQSLLSRLTGIPVLGSIFGLFASSTVSAKTQPSTGIKIGEPEREETILKTFEAYAAMYEYQNGEWSYRG